MELHSQLLSGFPAHTAHWLTHTHTQERGLGRKRICSCALKSKTVTSLNLLYVSVQCRECVSAMTPALISTLKMGFIFLEIRKSRLLWKMGHLMLMPQDDLDSKEDSQMSQIPCLEE